MKTIEIREAVVDDSAQILAFIKELASYEKAIDHKQLPRMNAYSPNRYSEVNCKI